jgi:hypothetical protein
MTFLALKLSKSMKKHLTSLLLIITIASAFTIKAGAADRWETLRAINWVENPTNQTKVGRFGELGPYQFRPATWRMHTDKPFRLAIQRQEADEVAVKHYEWIKRVFEAAGVEPNPFNIALAWNSGVDSVLSGRVPSASYNYAERVTNLVETFREGRRNLSEQKTVSLDNKSEQSPMATDAEQIHFRVLEDPPHFAIAAG